MKTKQKKRSHDHCFYRNNSDFGGDLSFEILV